MRLMLTMGNLGLEQGFEAIEPEYFLFHRVGPAEESLTEYVTLYLWNLLETTTDHLTERMRSRLAQLCDPTSGKFLPRQKSFVFGSMQTLILARAPHTSLVRHLRYDTTR